MRSGDEHEKRRSYGALVAYQSALKTTPIAAAFAKTERASAQARRPRVRAALPEDEHVGRCGSTSPARTSMTVSSTAARPSRVRTQLPDEQDASVAGHLALGQPAPPRRLGRIEATGKKLMGGAWAAIPGEVKQILAR